MPSRQFPLSWQSSACSRSRLPPETEGLFFRPNGTFLKYRNCFAVLLESCPPSSLTLSLSVSPHHPGDLHKLGETTTATNGDSQGLAFASDFSGCLQTPRLAQAIPDPAPCLEPIREDDTPCRTRLGLASALLI